VSLARVAPQGCGRVKSGFVFLILREEVPHADPLAIDLRSSN
jgi:hypothetical protein